MKKITIILPAHNEEESINLLEEQMLKVGKENPEYDWGFLLVNDGSTDRTLERYAQLCDKDNRFSYIDLSRNYGKEIAMLAGLDYALGDAVIIMDADMQHPINVIPEMLHYFEEGYDDVYAQRAKSEEKWFKRKSSSLYYRILEKMASIPVQKDTGDFRLLNRNCIEALKKMREVERNTKGLYGWIGFHKKCIKYEQLERQFGETK